MLRADTHAKNLSNQEYKQMKVSFTIPFCNMLSN